MYRTAIELVTPDSWRYDIKEGQLPCVAHSDFAVFLPSQNLVDLLSAPFIIL